MSEIIKQGDVFPSPENIPLGLDQKLVVVPTQKGVMAFGAPVDKAEHHQLPAAITAAVVQGYRGAYIFPK